MIEPMTFGLLTPNLARLFDITVLVQVLKFRSDLYVQYSLTVVVSYGSACPL